MSQAETLIAHLMRHGRTSCADLEELCDVRSVTSRISELIRRGAPIKKSLAYLPNRQGVPRPVTFYELEASPDQLDLFTPT